MVFAFPFMTDISLSMTISVSIHFAPNGINLFFMAE